MNYKKESKTMTNQEKPVLSLKAKDLIRQMYQLSLLQSSTPTIELEAIPVELAFLSDELQTELNHTNKEILELFENLMETTIPINR